jgi:hypothetical protein
MKTLKDYGAHDIWEPGYTDFDSTAALQAALDAGDVLLDGTYKTSAPLRVTHSLVGWGKYPTLVATITEPGRAAIECLGEGNTGANSARLENFRIALTPQSHKESWCLRAGDCRGFAAKRIICDGPNGLRLRVGSSASYAQIDTVFDQCRFASNYAAQWWANDDEAQAYAVAPESAGAAWDNVAFRSCTFQGLVRTRAFVVLFDCCQFSTNPKRQHQNGTPWGHNLWVPIGSATVRDCYFEDHDTAIEIAPGEGPIGQVLVTGSRFSGITNYGIDSEVGVWLTSYGAAFPVGYVGVRDSEFGRQYAARVRVTHPTAKVSQSNVRWI